MAQRVYLVIVPAAELAEVAAAIAGSAAERRELAERLAHAAMPHVERVTASERVGEAVEAKGTNLPDAWYYGRNCWPYLSVATMAGTGLTTLRAVEAMPASALDAHFRQAATALGATGKPKVPTSFADPPTETELRDWIVLRLDAIATKRPTGAARKTKGKDSAAAEHAAASCAQLAKIFSRLRPCFWQGKNRWLGDAAAPGGQDKRAAALMRNLSAPERMMLGLSMGGGRETRRPIAGLAELLVPTSDLCPELGFDDVRKALAPMRLWGTSTGAVHADRVGELRAAMQTAARARQLPYPNGMEWAEIVIAAATYAEETAAHLVEADDAFDGGYRWPYL